MTNQNFRRYEHVPGVAFLHALGFAGVQELAKIQVINDQCKLFLMVLLPAAPVFVRNELILTAILR